MRRAASRSRRSGRRLTVAHSVTRRPTRVAAGGVDARLMARGHLAELAERLVDLAQRLGAAEPVVVHPVLDALGAELVDQIVEVGVEIGLVAIELLAAEREVQVAGPDHRD